MPITIIEERDNSVGLMRVCYHDCSLGEFQHQLAKRIYDIFLARAAEKKERVNWHDLFQVALIELEHEGVIKSGILWQNLGNDILFPRNFIQAVQNYNLDPKSFHLTKMVPEKPLEPDK